MVLIFIFIEKLGPGGLWNCHHHLRRKVARTVIVFGVIVNSSGDNALDDDRKGQERKLEVCTTLQ